MKSQTKANLMLILITIFWGASYVLIKFGLNNYQTFNIIALRFIIAFFLTGIIFRDKVKQIDAKTLKYGTLLGGILFGVFATMTFGVKLTSASNAGFLVSLAVIFIPIILAVFLREKPKVNVIIGACTSILGISLLTLNQAMSLNTGDLLCILSALLYAVHIIVTGIFTQKVDSINLGIVQIGFVGLLSLLGTFLFEAPKLPSDLESWSSIVILSIFCTAIAFMVQTIAQQYTCSTHTGLIFTLEPVFAAGFAIVVADEMLTSRGYIGAVLLLLSIVIAELDFDKSVKSNETIELNN